MINAHTGDNAVLNVLCAITLEAEELRALIGGHMTAHGSPSERAARSNRQHLSNLQSGCTIVLAVSLRRAVAQRHFMDSQKHAKP
jgi:hypothetical protein